MPVRKQESFRVVDPDIGQIVKHGPYQTFSEKGKLVEKGQCQDGRKHGACYEYHENGKLKSVSRFRKGELHGRMRSYFADGSPQYDWNYKDNLPHGRIRTYDRRGLIEDSHRVYDRKHGSCKIWDKKRNLLAKGVYKNDMPHEGTFVIEEFEWPAGPSHEEFKDFEEYLNRFLGRRSLVVEFHKGQPVAVIQKGKRMPIEEFKAKKDKAYLKRSR